MICDERIDPDDLYFPSQSMTTHVIQLTMEKEYTVQNNFNSQCQLFHNIPESQRHALCIVVNVWLDKTISWLGSTLPVRFCLANHLIKGRLKDSGSKICALCPILYVRVPNGPDATETLDKCQRASKRAIGGSNLARVLAQLDTEAENVNLKDMFI